MLSMTNSSIDSLDANLMPDFRSVATFQTLCAKFNATLPTLSLPQAHIFFHSSHLLVFIYFYSIRFLVK